MSFKSCNQPELNLDPHVAADAEPGTIARTVDIAVRVTHQGELPFGDIRVGCAVTEDGRRVLSMRGLMAGIGATGNQKADLGGSKWPASLTRKGVEPYLGPVLADPPNQPIEVIVPQYINGKHIRDNIAHAVRAEVLVDICRAYVEADAAGALRASQKHIAVRCVQILSALAGHAMRDLVDRATGYEDRPSVPTPVLPKTYVDALRALADQVEATEAAQARAAALEPPARAWAGMVDTVGDYSVAEAAKILSRDPAISVGELDLFALLIGDLSMAFVEDGRTPEEKRARKKKRNFYQPYQTEVDAGRMTLRMGGRWQHPSGEWRSGRPQLRITTKGIEHIHKKLGGTGSVDFSTIGDRQ